MQRISLAIVALVLEVDVREQPPRHVQGSRLGIVGARIQNRLLPPSGGGQTVMATFSTASRSPSACNSLFSVSTLGLRSPDSDR